MSEVDEDIVQVVWLSSHLDMVIQLMNNYGGAVTLDELFKRISSEKCVLLEDIKKLMSK